MSEERKVELGSPTKYFLSHIGHKSTRFVKGVYRLALEPNVLKIRNEMGRLETKADDYTRVRLQNLNVVFLSSGRTVAAMIGGFVDMTLRFPEAMSTHLPVEKLLTVPEGIAVLALLAYFSVDTVTTGMKATGANLQLKHTQELRQHWQ